MKSLRRLRGRTGVVLDTMLFIYLFEDEPRHAALCERLLAEAETGTFRAVVTPVTAAELIVKPIRQGRPDLADRYRSALAGLSNTTFPPLDLDIGWMAGALRAKYSLPLPDMLQCAIAMRSGKPTLITNDRALIKVEEVDILVLDDLR
ncbi:MAG: type II toxin-antitoxin system VapC family toxin [Kiritimatiellae bacterium]|nr:type II toxin-antitoxin system VapC family toxin [Kiritimatiellia bacterium]